MKYYKEFLITAEPFNPDILSSMLWELDIQGINEEVGCLKVFTDENSPITPEEISDLLEKLKKEKMIKSFQIEENIYELKNWNEEWEKSLPIIEIDERIVIKPTFRDYAASGDKIVIEIDPKMSFGTGDHQTTRLVLQLMQKYLPEKGKVLDAGSGTGILSIAAVKLGASAVTAFDIDEWSFNNGTENAHLNSVAENINFILGEIAEVKEKDFDLVLANIQKNILLLLTEEIYSRIKQGGVLILSGLLITDKEDIVARYSDQGFKLIEVKQLDEWIAVVLIKK